MPATRANAGAVAGTRACGGAHARAGVVAHALTSNHIGYVFRGTDAADDEARQRWPNVNLWFDAMEVRVLGGGGGVAGMSEVV